MKLTNYLSIVLILAGTGFAQAPNTARNVAEKLKAATAAPAKQAAPAKPAAAPMPKPTMPATKPETLPVHKTMKPHATAKHVVKMHAAPKVNTAAKPAEAGAPKDETADVSPEIKRGRDPFVSVIMERSGGSPCTGAGKKCLIIDQVLLRGIVRSQNGSLAVVSSSANKTYFLRENDPVYNGVVVKITADSIVFRETVTDRLGKSIQREVVKKVNNPAA